VEVEEEQAERPTDAGTKSNKNIQS